jgi:hypothetical protein
LDGGTVDEDVEVTPAITGSAIKAEGLKPKAERKEGFQHSALSFQLMSRHKRHF